MSSLKASVEDVLKCTVSNDEMKKAEQSARRKLDWIIKLEGDSNGERLKPWYLTQLIAESVSQNRFSEACMLLLQMNIKNDCATL